MLVTEATCRGCSRALAERGDVEAAIRGRPPASRSPRPATRRWPGCDDGRRPAGSLQRHAGDRGHPARGAHARQRSTSRRSKPRRRSAPSTCARSRTRNGTCCPGPPTSRASCGPTPSARPRRAAAGRGVQAPPRALSRHRAAARSPRPGRRGRRRRAATAPAPALADGRRSSSSALIVALYCSGSGDSNDGAADAGRRRATPRRRPRRPADDERHDDRERRRRRRRPRRRRACGCSRPHRPGLRVPGRRGQPRARHGVDPDARRPQPTFRSTRFRVTLGNGAARLTIDGKLRTVPTRRGIGYEITTSGRRKTLRRRSARPADAERVAARAGVVVTGTEVLTGRVVDRNGPWLASGCATLGVELAHIAVVGDRPAGRRAAPCAASRDEGMDLIVTSGGLGPTEDDLTAEVVGRVPGPRRCVLDEALEGRIGAILEPLLTRWPDLRPRRAARSDRKQAIVPGGAACSSRSAPPRVSSSRRPRPGRPIVVVLPGPPRELQPMWSARRETDAFQAAIAGATELPPARCCACSASRSPRSPRRCVGPATPGVDHRRARDHDLPAARRGRGRHALRARPQAGVRRASRPSSRERHGDTLFSDDGATVDEQVAARLLALSARRATIAVAESCTGGLLAGAPDRARRAPRPTCWAGVVAYANAVKGALAGVDPALDRAHGAVSTEVAEAMADGARRVSAPTWASGSPASPGPGAAGEEKPVGLVCFSVAGPAARASPGRGAARRPRPTSATARRPSRCSPCGGCSPAERVTAPAPRRRANGAKSTRTRVRGTCSRASVPSVEPSAHDALPPSATRGTPEMAVTLTRRPRRPERRRSRAR